jgi:hypothetical protein
MQGLENQTEFPGIEFTYSSLSLGNMLVKAFKSVKLNLLALMVLAESVKSVEKTMPGVVLVPGAGIPGHVAHQLLLCLCMARRVGLSSDLLQSDNNFVDHLNRRAQGARL